MIKRGTKFGAAGDQYAQTPDCVWEWLNTECGKGGIGDICPPNHQHDALAPEANWFEICCESKNIYCNPPYNNVDKWLEKAEQQLLMGSEDKRVYFLIPSRTCTNGFHKYVLNGRFTSKIHFIRGRLTFKGYTKPNPTPMCIVEFNRWKFLDHDSIFREDPSEPPVPPIIKSLKLLPFRFGNGWKLSE